jgi:hypothetical protein
VNVSFDTLTALISANWREAEVWYGVTEVRVAPVMGKEMFEVPLLELTATIT